MMTTPTPTPPNAPQLSARGGFLLGIGTAAVAGALAIIALRYDGAPKTTPSAAPAVVAEAAAAPTETFPLAEHVAAMSGETAASTPSMQPAAATSQAPLLSGTIELDKSLTDSISGTMTVFVIARAGAGKGHPILAKRLDVASFPAKFSLSAADSMMAQAPPDHVSLEARIDLDRDAMTREPDVPAAKLESVSMGSKNVTLTLKRGV